MKPDTFKDWHDHAVFGIPGRLRQRIVGAKMQTQRWVSAPRPIKGYGTSATLRAELHFDDECGNGHSSFAVTGEVRIPGRRDCEACGCLHGDIAQVFPELAPLIKWHLTSTDGPMHYIANTLYHAGDQDHNGLRKGETRQIRDGKTGALAWIRKGTPTAYHDGDAPPTDAPLFVTWEPWLRTGEGKPRELDHARSAAVWPDATDAELCAPPEALRAKLEARLPALLAEFRAAIESTGLSYSVE